MWSVLWSARRSLSEGDPALLGVRAQGGVDETGGAHHVRDGRALGLAGGDGTDQTLDLDDLEVVVAERDRGVGLEGTRLAVGRPHDAGGPRGRLVVLTEADPKLAHSAEVPGQGAGAAVH